jgi:hypothetical protein
MESKQGEQARGVAGEGEGSEVRVLGVGVGWGY